MKEGWEYQKLGEVCEKSKIFDCSVRSTTYAIAYRTSIIAMMSSLLSIRVNWA